MHHDVRGVVFGIVGLFFQCLSGRNYFLFKLAG